MADEASGEEILSEARGAHATSRRILGLMLEEEGDPIREILTLLQAILEAQRRILTRLDILERKLTQRGERRAGSGE